MATILLDTSVIFDHLNGRYGRTEFLNQLLDEGHLLACCPVNITEVYAGLRPGEEITTEAFIRSLEFLPLAVEIARKAGLLRRDWRAKGQTLSYTDVTMPPSHWRTKCLFSPTIRSISRRKILYCGRSRFVAKPNNQIPAFRNCSAASSGITSSKNVPIDDSTAARYFNFFADL
jgi:predicted nucleic acid-binding protein